MYPLLPASPPPSSSPLPPPGWGGLAAGLQGPGTLLSRLEDRASEAPLLLQTSIESSFEKPKKDLKIIIGSSLILQMGKRRP